MAELIDPGPIELEAVIERSDVSGSISYVSIPVDLKATYGKGNLVPVKAMFDGRVAYTGSLAMMGGECPLLGVRKDVLAQLGKRPGDAIHVRIELDRSPRVVECPEDARVAIEAAPAASAFWEALSYLKQREFVEWIESAKKPETRERRERQTVELLAAGKRLKG